MLLSKEVVTTWNVSNREDYINKGYKFTKLKEELIVKVDDLSQSSHVIVEVLCDYCKEIIIKKPYHRYLKERMLNSKDCCNNVECQKIKRKEIFLLKYNETNPLKVKEIKEKMFNTNIEKYGNKTTLLNEEVMQKTKETVKELYGVEHNSQSEIIKEKKRQTCLKHFGVEYSLQSKEVRSKIEITNIAKYGFINPMQNELVREKGLKKSAETKYNNGTVKYSKQQEYICLLLDGILNYPVGRLNVDMLLDDNIVVEFEGGGHDLAVKLDGMNIKDFKLKEMRREMFIRSKKFCLVKIISISNKLPSDLKIIELINYVKDYLNTGHSWMNFDIDNSKVICSQFTKDYDYGELRRIIEKDLENFT